MKDTLIKFFHRRWKEFLKHWAILLSLGSLLCTSYFAYMAITADIRLRQCVAIEERFVAFEETAQLFNEAAPVTSFTAVSSMLSFGKIIPPAENLSPEDKGTKMSYSAISAETFDKFSKEIDDAIEKENRVSRNLQVHLAVAYAMINEDNLSAYREQRRKLAEAQAEWKKISDSWWEGSENTSTDGSGTGTGASASGTSTGATSDKRSKFGVEAMQATKKIGYRVKTTRETLRNNIIEVRALLSKLLYQCYND